MQNEKGAFYMLTNTRLNLQLFGEGGGDGGDGGSAVGTVGGAEVSERIKESGESNIPASIPEKAKKYYQKAMEKHSGSTTEASAQNSDNALATTEQGTTDKISYTDLIKSDEYKDEHKAYMDKTIGERLKKYKGIEESLDKHKAILDTVAYKYGVNPGDENFLEVLAEKIEADDSYYENYAMEHDISTDEARRIVTMERKAAQYDAEQEARQKQEQMRNHIMVLRQNAEKTKSQFPQFDLDTEMQDERFRRLCAANNGDTTAAYMACHWNEILPATVQMASRQIQAQTAQAVASNKARPVENGISSSAPSVVHDDFSNMNLQQIRKYAEEQRRKKTGR
jgi:hypothetical protein